MLCLPETLCNRPFQSSDKLSLLRFVIAGRRGRSYGHRSGCGKDSFHKFHLFLDRTNLCLLSSFVDPHYNSTSTNEASNVGRASNLREEGIIMDAIAAIYAFEKAWNSGDLEKAYSYFGEHYVFESVASGETAKGKAALTALMDGLLQAFPDLRFENKSVFASGNKVAAEYVLSGTQKKEFHGMPATGKSFSLRCCSILEFEGGLFTRETAYWDTATMMRQLGHLS